MRAEQNMAIQGGGAEFRSGCTATAATFHLGPCDLFQKPHELSYSGGFSGGGGFWQQFWTKTRTRLIWSLYF